MGGGAKREQDASLAPVKGSWTDHFYDLLLLVGRHRHEIHVVCESPVEQLPDGYNERLIGIDDMQYRARGDDDPSPADVWERD